MQGTVENPNTAAEDRADIARVLAAIALMAWLSSWSPSEPPADSIAVAATDVAVPAPHP